MKLGNLRSARAPHQLRSLLPDRAKLVCRWKANQTWKTRHPLQPNENDRGLQSSPALQTKDLQSGRTQQHACLLSSVERTRRAPNPTGPSCRRADEATRSNVAGCDECSRRQPALRVATKPTPPLPDKSAFAAHLIGAGLRAFARNPLLHRKGWASQGRLQEILAPPPAVLQSPFASRRPMIWPAVMGSDCCSSAMSSPRSCSETERSISGASAHGGSFELQDADEVPRGLAVDDGSSKKIPLAASILRASRIPSSFGTIFVPSG